VTMLTIGRPWRIAVSNRVCARSVTGQNAPVKGEINGFREFSGCASQETRYVQRADSGDPP
jgi:hypothetical protein